MNAPASHYPPTSLEAVQGVEYGITVTITSLGVTYRGTFVIDEDPEIIAAAVAETVRHMPNDVKWVMREAQ